MPNESKPFRTYFSLMTSKSIAILPLINLSSDPENEYFSDGITEEIILALSKTQGLKVTARTSSFMFKGRNLDVRSIGKQLGVSTVLEGSIRKSGESVRIAVNLVRTDDGFHIWSEKFDRQLEDIFELQDEISVLVADKIRENFGHIELQSTFIEEEVHSVDAYDYYLKGRYEQLKWTTDALQRAIEFYKKSLELDPKNSRACYGIVLCYIYKGFWSSDEEDIAAVYKYMEKAVRLNSKMAEYYLAKASAEMMIEWDFRESIENFRQLLMLNSNNPEVLEAIAGMYLMFGEFGEAMIHIDRALELNPLSVNHSFMKGNILYFAGNYEKAIVQMDRVITQTPDWMYAVQLKAAALILTNSRADFDELMDDYADHAFMKHYNTLYRLYHGLPIGDYELPFLADETIHPWQLYFSVLEGEHEASLTMLEQGLEQKHGKYMCFNYDPFLSKLREKPDFARLSKFIQRDLPLLSEVYQEAINPKPLITDEDERAELHQALDQAMAVDRVFLDSDLSLKKLAEILNSTSNKLSWLINEEKQVNFNDFINTYRMEHFKQLALDPENKNLTLLGLAFDSGFNSKSAFNTSFKKLTGQTPRAWLNAQK